jgi:hypothetical protein
MVEDPHIIGHEVCPMACQFCYQFPIWRLFWHDCEPHKDRRLFKSVSWCRNQKRYRCSQPTTAYSQRGLPHVECDQRVCSPIDRRFKHHLIATITSVSATGSAASKLAATWTAILSEAKLDGGVKPVKVPRANFCWHCPFGNYAWRGVAGATSGIYRRKPAPSQA